MKTGYKTKFISVLLCALFVLITGCSANNGSMVPVSESSLTRTEEYLPGTSEKTDLTPATEDIRTTETVPSTTEPGPAESDAAEADTTERRTAEPDVLPENRLVINHLPERTGDVYSLPMAAQIRDETDPRMKNVTRMSQEELSDYYGLSIGVDALGSALEPVLGDKVSADIYSGYLPSPGIFRDGESVYDANTIDLRTRHASVRIILTRYQNTRWPGGEILQEQEPEEEPLETSCLGGTECVVCVYGQEKISTNRIGYDVEAMIGNTKVSISIGGVSEEKLAEVLETIYVLLHAATPAAESSAEVLDPDQTDSEPGTTVQSEPCEDRIVMNLITEYVYSLLWSTVTEDDPRWEHVTLMSWEELSDYYGLNINEKAVSDMIRSVVGKSFDSYSGSPCLPSTGIYRDGDRIYDGNFLELNTSPEGVTIVFSKDNNILWPGYEGRLEHDPADDQYETSCIGGIECVIGRLVSETGTVQEASYEIDASFRDTEMSIQTYGLSEEEAVTFFIELCRLIDPAG